jgi:hypothetical protein
MIPHYYNLPSKAQYAFSLNQLADCLADEVPFADIPKKLDLTPGTVAVLFHMMREHLGMEQTA